MDKAVKAAHAAFRSPAWKGMSATDRGILMGKLADLIEANKELFATIDAWDNGKGAKVRNKANWRVNSNLRRKILQRGVDKRPRGGHRCHPVL